MKFEKGIAKEYRKSIEDAIQTISETGNARHRQTLKFILESKMTISVHPVSRIHASGVTGVTDRDRANERIESERMSLRDAFDEIFITIAEETIDTGFQRGCEGTLVHEGQHAYDFAQTIESFSNADINPLSIFNPTLYELEREAHLAAGEYMLLTAKQDFLDEGLSLMILGRNDSGCFIDNEGIIRRLKESYELDLETNQGAVASQILGLNQK